MSKEKVFSFRKLGKKKKMAKAIVFVHTIMPRIQLRTYICAANISMAFAFVQQDKGRYKSRQIPVWSLPRWKW